MLKCSMDIENTEHTKNTEVLFNKLKYILHHISKVTCCYIR